MSASRNSSSRGAGPSRFDCSRCRRIFKTREKLREHCLTEINCARKGSGGNASEASGSIFNGLSSFQSLPSISHSSRGTRHGSNLPPGAQSDTQELFKCDTCHKSYNGRRALVTHVRNVHSNKKRCSHCNAGFVTSGGLERHERREHQLGQEHKCQTCGLGFASSRRLESHNRDLHSERGEFSCKHCQESFSKRSTLRAHMENEHDGGYIFSCKLCPTSYRKRTQIQRHVRDVHDKRRPNHEHYSERKTR